jgi:hypothetical protein
MSSSDGNLRRSPDLLYSAILALVGLAFALVPLARGELFFFWDNARLYYPQTVALHDGLRAGYMPQWSFAVSNGYPIVGEGQGAHYHPIRLLLAWLFPPQTAFMLEIGIYMALIGITTYFFLRTFRVPHWACLLAGLTNLLGGFSVISVKNIAHPRSLWILPLVLLLAERFVRGPRKTLWILLAGLAFGLQLLSGNPHFAAITAVGSGLYVFFRTWHRQWNQDASLRATVWSVSAASIVWALAGIMGFALAAIQMMPQLLHAEQSTRQGGMSFDFAVSLPANLRYLGQLLLPFAYEQGHVIADPATRGGRHFNDVSYRGLYMGMVPIVLAALAVWRGRRWPWPGWALLALAIAGTALALGQQTPLYPALWSLPFFGSLRYTYRFLALAAFCIACLAGLGLAHLQDPDAERQAHGRALRDAIPLVALFGVGLAGAAYLWVAPPAWMLLAPDFERGTLISLGMLAAACLLVFAAARSTGRWRRGLCVVLILFTAADLWWFRARSDYAPSIKFDSIMSPPPVAAFLSRDDQTFRIMSLERWESASTRLQDVFEFALTHASSLWGIDSADPYESLMLRRYFMVHEALSYELLTSPAAARQLQGLLGALNVKYVISPRAVTLEGWDRVFETPRSVTWRNPTIKPRAFLVGRVLPERIVQREEWVDRARKRQGRYPDMVKSWDSRVADSQIIDNVLADSVDYTTTALVAAQQMPVLTGPDSTATLVNGPAQGNALHFSVTAARPQLLVVSNNYYPGWTARVNGEPAPIYRTNWVASGLLVPAGRSEVVLRFSTPGLKKGTVVSLVTLVLILAALRWENRRARARLPDPDAR